jgi:hypothetical protein
MVEIDLTSVIIILIMPIDLVSTGFPMMDIIIPALENNSFRYLVNS